MNNKNYKAVIFDVDGTLLDTTEGILAAVSYTIEKSGLPKIDRETLLTFIGPPVQDSFKRVYGVSVEKAQELATIFRDRYKDVDLLKAVAYDGIYDLLDFLKKKDIAIAVATYKRQDYAETILRHFNFDNYSDILYGADNENKLKKADIIKLCIRDMHIEDMEEIVMVGDSMHDANGAQALGMDFIGVTYGFDFKTKKQVMDCGAWGYADTPLDILRYFN